MLRLFSLPILMVALASSALAAGGPERGYGSGTHRGGVITERFAHEQAAKRRGPTAAVLAEPQPLRQAVGDIAIIDSSNGVVMTPNFIDIQGNTFTFTPAGDGYAGAASAQSLDQTAREQGVSLGLGDDDAQQISLPFDFPFFGKTHRSAFVHSDGTITFEETDTTTAARSFARAASGPPRIAPMFVDLDPSQTAARVRSFISGDRAVFTWDGVPEYSSFGNGRRQIFQCEMHADGTIVFHYLTANLTTIVVGVFPGRLEGEVTPVDLTAGFSATPSGFAEQFALSGGVDAISAAQQFYRQYEDAYDFLVIFNNMELTAGPGSFAYELNVRNEILGIGDLLSPEPVFDFGEDFGSPRRLSSFLEMGPLSQYPEDPALVVPFIGENSTLSVLGQEAGHRWLAYVDFIDPATGLRSSNLLGRQQAHWSFFYNSNASVLEGNRIEDRGAAVSPRFRTVEAVARFSELDQYIMGLRSPEDTPAGFLVEDPVGASNSSPSRAPQTEVSFNGTRKDIPLELIIAAEGPRVPDHTVSEKEFRFAFILLVDSQAATIPQEDIEKIDRIRREWEDYFETAVGGRAQASTSLVKMLHLSSWPAAGVLAGGSGAARVAIAEPLEDDLVVGLSSDSGAITVPATVTIPAGETGAEITFAGNAAGVAKLTATAGQPGFDTAVARIQVNAQPAALSLTVVSGEGQAGLIGEPLPEPIIVEVRDANNVRYTGATLNVEVLSGGGSAPAAVVTDADGRASIEWTSGPAPADGELRVSLDGAPGVNALVSAAAAGAKPIFSSDSVVNAASFNVDGSSQGLAPGSLVTIFGEDLAPADAKATGFPLPRSLSTASVRVNGSEAPLLAVFGGQINFQMPFEVTAGQTATIAVTTSTSESEEITVTTAAVDPGVFFDSTSGVGAIRFSSDGQTAYQRAASPGEFLEIYATGLGAVAPRTETGEAASGFFLSRTDQPVFVVIGEQRIEASFAGLAPSFAGLYQVNVGLPEGLAAGTYDVRIEIGGRLSNAVQLTVGP